MSLTANLTAARDAIDYAQSLLKYGSSNKREDRLRSAGGIEKVIDAGKGFDPRLIRHLNAHRSAIDFNRLVATSHDVLAASGAGNCMELAAAAMMYLRYHKVKPLDYMRFDAKGYDHVWVVIGRVAGSDPGDLRSWGPDAVWCDPWQGDGVAFSVQAFIKGQVRNLNFLFKCDSVERVEAGNPVVEERDD